MGTIVLRNGKKIKVPLETQVKLDGNKVYFDGELIYEPKEFKVDFSFVRENIGRSGDGKDGKGPRMSARLCDMSDEWVEASILYVTDQALAEVYQMELDYRKEKDITIGELPSWTDKGGI